MCVCVCVCARARARVCVCVCFLFVCLVGFFLLPHVKALLKALEYMIFWFNHSTMDGVIEIMFYLVIISYATNEFLPANNKGFLYWIKLNT